MTVAEAKTIAKSAGALLLAIAAPLIVALLVGAWRSKESVEDHNADVTAIRSDVQRILDVVCEGKSATTRACK